MQNKAIYNQIISFILIICTLFSLILPAYGDANAGGNNFGGKVSIGAWSAKYQGVRISIITDTGEYALWQQSDNGGKFYSMDLLSSQSVTAWAPDSTGAYTVKVDKAIDYSQIDYFYGGTRSLDHNISSFTYKNPGTYDVNSMQALFDQAAPVIKSKIFYTDTWKRFVSTEGPYRKVKYDASLTSSDMDKLKDTRPIRVGSDDKFYAQGEKVAKIIYGNDLSANTPALDSLIWLLFNVYYKDGSVADQPVWRLTQAASEIISDEDEVRYNAGTKNSPDIYSTLQLCADYGFAICIEPIIFANIRYSKDEFSGITLYGTPSNIAQGIDHLISTGEMKDTTSWFSSKSLGTPYGGYDRGLHHISRYSFILSKTWDYGGKTYSTPPAYSSSSFESNAQVKGNLSDNEIVGYAMHLYVLGSNPKTHTYDDEKYPPDSPSTYTEHPAPDPVKEKCTKDKTKEADRKYNIVKFYEIEQPAPDGSAEKIIQHVATYTRDKTIPKIQVQDEEEAGGYKVVEWKWSADPIPSIKTGKKDEGATEWLDPMIEGLNVKPENKSTEETRVSLVNITNKTADGKDDKETVTTLYVRLRKEAKVPATHTLDDPLSPGPAPDPLAPDETPNLTNEEKKQLVHNIVKVYETKLIKSDLTEEIKVDTITVRTDTAGIIDIEDEAHLSEKYSAKEWLWSTSDSYNSGGQTWGAVVSPVSPVLGSGYGPEEAVDIRNPDDIFEPRTLYLHLYREKKEPPEVDGGLDIEQSQISKAIHTNATTIPGEWWGSYRFDMMIGPFEKTHTYYIDHGCCQKVYGTACDEYGCWTYVIHDCGNCHGHSCGLAMTGIDGDDEMNFVFGQIGGPHALQIGDGVHGSTTRKVYSKVSQKEYINNDLGISKYYYNSDGNDEYGRELVTVIWRGTSLLKDVPTLAKYKENDIKKGYGSSNWEIPQAMLKNASNVSKKSRTPSNGNYSFNLAIEFGLDTGKSDIKAVATCAAFHIGDPCPYYSVRQLQPFGGTRFTYNFKSDVMIKVYKGASKNLAAQPFGGVQSNPQQVKTGNHFMNYITQGNQQIKFYPYIKMTYMTNSLSLAEKEEANQSTYKQNTRYDTYVLSEYESAILPSDAIEIGWQNNSTKDTLLMTSQQWSLHQKAINGGQAWNGANQVLPGGAIYQLSTPNNSLTNVKIISYQTIVDDKTRGYLSSKLTGDEYTAKKVAKDHENFVNNAKEVLDNLRVVQWISKDATSEFAWPSDFVGTSSDGKLLLADTGGQKLQELGSDMKHTTSTDDKYYMKKVKSPINYTGAKLGDITYNRMTQANEAGNEGDLDVMKITQVTTVFKVFTDTSGNVYLASMQHSGTDGVEAAISSMVNSMKDLNADTMGSSGASVTKLAGRGTSGSAINGVLSGDAKQIDDRTKFITNAVSCLTRNEGKDKTAKWATSDGKWYNEAFDGIYLVRQAATITIGLQYSGYRTSALDPALCPVNKGQSDLYTKAFMSQFCLNSTSDATIAKGKPSGWLGTWRAGTSDAFEVVLPDIESMYISRKFYIPNANVQDLN